MKTGISALFVAPLLLFACAHSTTGPGAGAAVSTVKGNVTQVNQVAQNVFQEMNIQPTQSSVKNSGTERELIGKQGDTTVTVKMNKAATATTKVEVDASKNAFQGKQDLAQQVLSRIVEAS